MTFTLDIKIPKGPKKGIFKKKFLLIWVYNYWSYLLIKLYCDKSVKTDVKKKYHMWIPFLTSRIECDLGI